MNFTAEQARTQSVTAGELIRLRFPEQSGRGALDAEFLDGGRKTAVGFSGLPYEAPVCGYLMNQKEVADYLAGFAGNQIFVYQDGRLFHFTEEGERAVSEAAARGVMEVYERIMKSCGTLNEKGELLLDLKAYPVGPHYPVNLLLGNRAGYPYPLCTTPKSALDSLGRGSFRGTGGKQVLATRYVLRPEENGEPANRQFYLVENGKQLFYSANVRENVKTAFCRHFQNRTVITYETECGLEIKRRIFILPQAEGMPNAVEAQRVEITNHSGRSRKLGIVMTGMFGITEPGTLANDVIYANVVVESEIYYKDGRPAAMTLHHKPKDCQNEKRFALLLEKGRTMDSFCVSLSDFIGGGTLEHPDLVCHLPSRYGRKMTPFFAMGKSILIPAGETAAVDSFVGMMETEEGTDVSEAFDAALGCLFERYRDPAVLEETFRSVTEFWERYSSYLSTDFPDKDFNAYVGHNLPFQVLYQTYVSRAFAWTQKSYRETGFREIQDIYASMYYLSAMGENALIKELLSNWIRNVFPMGYAYHDFTFAGKEPGDCSDDQLWLVQAVYRYVKLTGDTAFLNQEYPMAGSEGGTRPLWDTIMAILTYSGKISVGKHGLPLLDKADWNDTLKLDRTVMKGPEKEQVYRKQLEKSGKPYGTPLENTLCESVMNACLLLIAADETEELARMTGRAADGKAAGKISASVRKSMQDNAWKGEFFARCLINDERPYTYLGAGGDGLSLDPALSGSYFLNSYSWPILSGAAFEEQIRTMYEVVEKHLKTEAGLKLCTLVDFDRLGVNTGTALYFPGDRENCGVFKHAAMMAAVASLKAAKQVKDEALAGKLADLAFFMIGKTLPFTTMKNPFVLKGNPRFCTQYNNSETCEQIGPMLSGTASWLTLAVYEFLGIDIEKDMILFAPVLPKGMERMDFTLRLEDARFQVEVTGDGQAFRAGAQTEYIIDGVKTGAAIPRPRDKALHKVEIRLAGD